MTEKDKKTLKRLLEDTRNPHAIRRQYGFSLSEIRAAMKDLPPLPGWGRVSLQPYIISRQALVGFESKWPAEDMDCILTHRRLHDQGRVTMCQGRDGNWMLLYAIPNTRPVAREPYFYGEPT